jgi:SPP1 gp7 family putative phage head morphogenesis protein
MNAALVDRLDLYGAGAEAAEDLLLDVFRIEKALDPLDADDFMAIVRRLSRALRAVARPHEDAALRRALERLDVDWPNLTPRARDQVVRAARQALGSVEQQVLPAIDQIFELEAERVVAGARRSAVRRLGARIGAATGRGDERVARFVRESQGNFVRDEYGRRRADFTAKAKDIIAAGVERGLGRDDIVRDLSTTMAREAFDQSRDYWEMVSMVFANRARTYTQLGAFEEAGVERYRFEAVLDEVTSEVCRFMHGKVFIVDRAVERFRAVERARDPETIRELQPFLQVGADRDGNEVLFYERGGRRRAVARVDEPAEGVRDEVGRYSRALSPSQLEAAGVSVPPIHGRCRSTIVAEV